MAKGLPVRFQRSKTNNRSSDVSRVPRGSFLGVGQSKTTRNRTAGFSPFNLAGFHLGVPIFDPALSWIPGIRFAPGRQPSNFCLVFIGWHALGELLDRRMVRMHGSRFFLAYKNMPCSEFNSLENNDKHNSTACFLVHSLFGKNGEVPLDIWLPSSRSLDLTIVG